MNLDTSKPDKGLASIFDHVRLNDDLYPLRGYFTDPRGVTQWQTTDDFYYHINPESSEAHFEAILDNFDITKKAKPRDPANHLRDRAISKLRQAYKIASRLCKALEDLAPDADEDLDKPLTKDAMEDLQHKWMSRYNLKLRIEFSPVDENVAMYHRMFKKTRAMKFIKLDKHKASSTDVQTFKMIDPGLSGINKIYKEMRIMANAMAKAGNFMVTCSYTGKETIMAPLDVNLNYADDAFQRAIKMGTAAWLRERDQMTREIMVDKIKDGISQGVALTQAWKETTFEWKDATLLRFLGRKPTQDARFARSKTPPRKFGKRGRSPYKRPYFIRSSSEESISGSRRNSRRTRSPPPSRSPGRRRKGRGKGKDKRAKGKKAKDDAKSQKNNRFVPTGKGGKTVCINWNMKKGCSKGEDCSDLHHYCNRRLTAGGGCGKDHPAHKCDNPDAVK
jgi:hypothetical protein